MASDAKAEQWACNLAQWVRTALTDVYHGMGQAEIGNKPTLAKEMKSIASELETMEKKLQMKYHVPPATGVGRKMKRQKKQQS